MNAPTKANALREQGVSANQSELQRTNHTAIFEQLARACPVPEGDTFDVITVVVDEQHLLGKVFTELPDGNVDKQSAVAVARGVACQYHVPDLTALEAVLRIVSENPHAAIINSGWKPVAIGEMFVFLSTRILAGMGLEREAITTDGGMTAFARLKDHATPSTLQLLDRDEDKFTPDWAIRQSFDEWRLNLDKILPGFAKLKMLRAHSSSARVLKADGSAVGGGNGHVWIKVADSDDTERTRTAIMARALEHDLAWAKPRFSKVTGLECARGSATIVDSSVWVRGRLVFVGRPTCSAGLTISPQHFEHIDGDNDVLDTSQAVISILKTYRASAKKGVPLRLSRSGNRFRSVMHNLSLDTEIEIDGGSVTTVRELMLNFADKIRCQSPFRASTSMAAFFALDGRGEPFVYDSGTDTHHVLEKPVMSGATDNDLERLIDEVKYRLGELIGKENVDAVFNYSVMITAWHSTFFNPVKSAIVALNWNDGIISLSVGDFTKFGFRRSFGKVYYNDLLEEVIEEQHLSQKLEEILRKSLAVLEHGPFIEHLKLVKQATSLDISVDMFTTRGVMSVADGIAVIVLPHRLFVLKEVPEAEVVTQVVGDYIQHFPEFLEFLALVLYARFATDRRHAFVWLHTPSSWGKGFLVAIFQLLGLVVEVSASEIEKAMAGGPVGLSLTDTLRTWILFVDEFKAASRELKLLNRQMSISPKHQLRCTVQLYTKLFASAENVRSLVGEGVEEQFNNRFAYLSPSTIDHLLEDRPLFKELGKAVYLGALAGYVAGYLNDGVDRLCAMGPIESSKVADAFAEKYQAERRLQPTFGSLDDAVDDVVAEIRQCLIEYARWQLSGATMPMPDAVQGLGMGLLNTLKRTAATGYVSRGENSKQRELAIVLGSPVPFIKSYLALSEDRSTVGKMQYKVDVIAAKLHMRTEPYMGRVRVYDRYEAGEESANKRGVVVFCDLSTTKALPPPKKRATNDSWRR
jgi:hypothetical protein